MAKKQDSEFRAWFVEQHGQRPSPAQTHELQAEYMRAQEMLNTRRRLLEQCNDYDARETSALYAWQAARSNVELTGSRAGSSPVSPESEANGVERRVGPRHPTLDECGAAGMGPTYMPGHGYTEGGLPATPEERERFEAYMRGHCWDAGGYDAAKHCYDTVGVRMLYGVWRDRGALPTTWPNAEITGRASGPG